VKVLVLTSSFPRYENSHEVRWVLELTQWIAKQRFSPIVLAPHFSGGKLKESWGRVQVQRFMYFLPFSFERLAYGPGLLYNIRKDFLAFLGIVPFILSEFISAALIQAREPVKIMHTHWLIPQGCIGALFHQLVNIPHISTVHGSDLNLITQNRILAPIGRFVILNSTFITVNSTYMKRELELFYPECHEKIRVIPMGIDPEKYRVGNFSDLKKKYQAKNIILSVGRLIDWKGTIFLINAMPKIIKDNPETVLLIAGAGPEKESLICRVQELSLERTVFFLGVVSNEDLLSFYHSADVFVLPSINKGGKTEALGVVLLEAMASGCPVIGSNVGGVSDIIIDGENGLLVPERNPTALAEKISLLLADSELREKFRRNGFAHIEKKFSWEYISQQFSDLFNESVETSRINR
jgi:L-malate glycosyltransferase